MLLFMLGFICCWYIIAAIIVFANIDISSQLFFKFITFPIWIIILPISYIIVFIYLIKFKIISLLKKER